LGDPVESGEQSQLASSCVAGLSRCRRPRGDQTLFIEAQQIGGSAHLTILVILTEATGLPAAGTLELILI
jgi:hypothetical protein